MPISIAWPPRPGSSTGCPHGKRRSSAGRGPASFQPMSTTHIATLLTRIFNKQARIGVIGLGYVGLPLAVEFARAGFDVTGFDVDATKVEAINAGRSYIPDVAQQDLADVVLGGRLRA